MVDYAHTRARRREPVTTDTPDPAAVARDAEADGRRREQERLERFGLTSECCDGERLGLNRFSSRHRLARAGEKSDIEQLYNPFGDPWRTRSASNRFIPVGTSSCRRNSLQEYGRRYDVLHSDPSNRSAATKDYVNYAFKSGSPYHYDETIGRLSKGMTEFIEMKRHLEAHGLKKKFIGYTVLNYDDGLLFPPHEELPEHYYVHKPEWSRRKTDRVRFQDNSTLLASGDVFDIRLPEVRRALAFAVVDRMKKSGIDAVLVDYAVRRYAFGAPTLIDDMPAGWFEDFQEHQHALVREVFEMVKNAGRELFLNGVMLDSIVVTEPALVQLYIKSCHGLFWEQPFRWEWRNYDNAGVDYYERLEQFLKVAQTFKKKIVFKIGSYRYHGTEDVLPGWMSRYPKTNAGIERHLAEYFTCLYLLFMNRHYNHLIYTHPTELFDIFSSEAYFDFWDHDIGEATTGRVELSPHVNMRVFERAVVLVNNTLKPADVWAPLPAEWGCGERVLVTMKPLSGRFVLRSEMERGWRGRAGLAAEAAVYKARMVYRKVRGGPT